MVADGVELCLELAQAFGCLGAGAGLAVVEGVFGTLVGRRQVGHHHIGSGQDALQTALWRQGGQRCGRRNECCGQHQSDDAIEPRGHVDGAVGLVAQWGVVLGDEWPQSHHVWPELSDELNILNQMSNGLPWAAHHDARAHLIAQFLEPIEALQTLCQAHLGRMQTCIVCSVVCLMTQQIAVGAALAPQRIDLTAVLAQRQGDGTVRPTSAHVADNVGHPLGALVAPLTALQHKGAEPQPIALLATVQHLLACERVSLDMAVAAADAAVQAVVAAHVGQLDEPPQIDAGSILLLCHSTGASTQIADHLMVVGGE